MRSGIEAFVREGRIATYPAKAARRLELLGWVVPQVLNEHESLTEAAFTNRLAELTDDPVTLRRYLIDAGLVRRTPGGAAYTLPPAADRVGPTP